MTEIENFLKTLTDYQLKEFVKLNNYKSFTNELIKKEIDLREEKKYNPFKLYSNKCFFKKTDSGYSIAKFDEYKKGEIYLSGTEIRIKFVNDIKDKLSLRNIECTGIMVDTYDIDNFSKLYNEIDITIYNFYKRAYEKIVKSIDDEIKKYFV